MAMTAEKTYKVAGIQNMRVVTVLENNNKPWHNKGGLAVSTLGTTPSHQNFPFWFYIAATRTLVDSY